MLPPTPFVDYCAKICRAFFMFSRIFTPNGQFGSHLPHIRQSLAVAESAQ